MAARTHRVRGFFIVPEGWVRAPARARYKAVSQRRFSMIVNMSATATREQVEHVMDRIRECGFLPHLIEGAERTVIGVVGKNRGRRAEVEALRVAPGVDDIISISQPFTLVSRELQPQGTVVDVRGVKIGGPSLVMIAGPCSVESREQLMETARSVKASGAHLLRGGAYKPRTSPYDFQGLGLEGLKILAEAREETGLPIVTEVMGVEDLDAVVEYADMMQVGARNMQNYPLLRRLATVPRPVLLKRGPSATIKEWLLAAEYLLSGGNPNVVLCERGIKTFDSELRNTLDLAGVALAKELSHLPIMVDPSHATGRRSLVPAAARAAVAIGADGIIVEVHPCPERALSDGPQSLDLPGFSAMMKGLQPAIAMAAVGR
ncbi:MAG TPA: 3-deoxy-7-phosphoheptulonate synthase [Candidatus Acidoferrales bacterium]